MMDTLVQDIIQCFFLLILRCTKAIIQLKLLQLDKLQHMIRNLYIILDRFYKYRLQKLLLLDIHRYRYHMRCIRRKYGKP